MRRALLSIPLLALTLAAGVDVPAAHASPPAGEFCSAASRNLTTGSWAAYRVTDTRGRASSLRFAALPGKVVDGVAHVWVEMSVELAPGRKMVTQTLVPGFPYERGSIKEMLMQPDPASPPTRMPTEMIARMAAMGGASATPDLGCAAMKKVGTETITVPAGTFVADHYRHEQTGDDTWVSAAGPNGIAFLKARMTTGTMELTASGTGATSSFTMAPAP